MNLITSFTIQKVSGGVTQPMTDQDKNTVERCIRTLTNRAVQQVTFSPIPGQPGILNCEVTSPYPVDERLSKLTGQNVIRHFKLGGFKQRKGV